MNEPLLHEDFRAAALDARLGWLNPPKRWRLDPRGPGLVVEPDGQTDFWQRTHYGFSADNGHFLGMELCSDFVLSTEVRLHPVHQYDQAGLMIRGDANCWIKASVEHELEGRPQLGAVVTSNGYSDWSLQDLRFPNAALCLRITKHGADVRVEFSPAGGPSPHRRGRRRWAGGGFGPAGGGPWQLMRVARLHWPDSNPLRAGLYACSPKDAGFRAEFAFLRVELSPAPTPAP